MEQVTLKNLYTWLNDLIVNLKNLTERIGFLEKENGNKDQIIQIMIRKLLTKSILKNMTNSVKMLSLSCLKEILNQRLLW